MCRRFGGATSCLCRVCLSGWTGPVRSIRCGPLPDERRTGRVWRRLRRCGRPGPRASRFRERLLWFFGMGRQRLGYVRRRGFAPSNWNPLLVWRCVRRVLRLRPLWLWVCARRWLCLAGFRMRGPRLSRRRSVCAWRWWFRARCRPNGPRGLGRLPLRARQTDERRASARAGLFGRLGRLCSRRQRLLRRWQRLRRAG